MLKNLSLPAYTPPPPTLGTNEVFNKNRNNRLILIELEMGNILSLKMAVLYALLLVGIA